MQHVLDVYTTTKFIQPNMVNSFKYQGVKILNDLKKINIYQNNVSKSKFWKELKSKLLSNLRSLIVLSCRVFYLFCSNQFLSAFSSSYPVATSVLIICAKNVLRYSNNHSTEMHFTCRWSLKNSF